MCTSLARDSIASIRISFTSRMTEASCAISESSEPSVSISLEQLDVVVVFGRGHQAVDRFAADAQVLLDELGDFVARRRAPA